MRAGNDAPLHKFHIAFAAAQNYLNRAHEAMQESKGGKPTELLAFYVEHARNELADAFEVLPEEARWQILIAEATIRGKLLN